MSVDSMFGFLYASLVWIYTTCSAKTTTAFHTRCHSDELQPRMKRGGPKGAKNLLCLPAICRDRPRFFVASLLRMTKGGCSTKRIRPLFLLCLFFGIFIGSETVSASEEFRAIWVSRWEYIKGTNPDSCRSRIAQIFNKAKAARFNAIIFQVRGQADAFYRSSYDPWAAELTGTLGRNPGWDPLAYAVEQARKTGIEIHAWANVYPCWKGTKPPPNNITPQHLYWAHPEWLAVEKGGRRMQPQVEEYASLSPGIPEARKYLVKVLSEIVEKYDVDGLHLDYVRYPGPNYSYDPVSLKRFKSREGNPDGLSWQEWQREQVNILVREIYDFIESHKPRVKLSAAVIGRYDEPKTGWDAYNIVYQDPIRWLREGKIDMLIPMIYWAREGKSPYGRILQEWTDESYGRQVAAGVGAFKFTKALSEVEGQVELARTIGANGTVLFSYASIDESKWWSNLSGGVFAESADIPQMAWKNVKPEPPSDVIVYRVSPSAIVVSWKPPKSTARGDTPAKYNIYRATVQPGKKASRSEKRWSISNTSSTWVDQVSPGSDYLYAVSTSNQAGIESQRSVQKSSGSRGLAMIRMMGSNSFSAVQTSANPIFGFSIRWTMSPTRFGTLSGRDRIGSYRAKPFINHEHHCVWGIFSFEGKLVSLLPDESDSYAQQCVGFNSKIETFAKAQNEPLLTQGSYLRSNGLKD